MLQTRILSSKVIFTDLYKKTPKTWFRFYIATCKQYSTFSNFINSSKSLKHSYSLKSFLKSCEQHRQISDRLVLGIETSCDETGAAVVCDAGNILGEVVFSQQNIHLNYGGINPPIAAELHRKHIESVVTETLDKSKISINDVSAIATTVKPGLSLSLLAGLEYSKHLVKISGRPFIPIHHMEAHALIVRMIEKVEFPFLVLLASGGHCQLAVVKDVESFFLLGTDIDNGAPGEALDKVARRLKLKNIPECSEMSGGRAIEYLAKKGNPSVFEFSMPLSRYQDCNFAFNGLKNQAFELILKEEAKYEIEADLILPNVADICASFQLAITRHLTKRLQRALIYCNTSLLQSESDRTVIFSGGVASNSYIRAVLSYVCEKMGYKLICPPPKFCTDNGVMIAWNGVEKLRKNIGIVNNPDTVNIQQKCSLGEDISEDVSQAKIKIDRIKITEII